MTDQQQIEAAIQALDAQRHILGEEVVEASIEALREKLVALETAAEQERQRKQVTILFADTVGSTAMCKDLDPETVLEIMDGGLRVFGDVIDTHHGRVARLMGDGLLAFFGTPVAQEDDPIRAVRAGLDIVQTAVDYAATVESRWGVRGFAVRVGIHTGLVALGEVGGPAGSEYTAMGDAANLTARLQSAASENGVLISHTTFQHVRGLFDLLPQTPIQVKGRVDPIQAYQVLRGKPRTFQQGRRGVEGVETETVGRVHEMARLRAALDRVMAEQALQILLITGEAGVGKSRLIRDFETLLDAMPERFRFFKGRAGLDTEQLPNGLIRDLLFSRCHIYDSDQRRVVLDKLTSGVLELSPTPGQAQMRAQFIGHWIGIEFDDSPYLSEVRADPQQIRDRGLMYLSELFRAGPEQQATVLFLEDIHWADDSSLDAIQQLALTDPAQPLLIVCTARPPFTRRYPHWGVELPGYSSLNLKPLGPEDNRKLIAEILHKVGDIPDNLIDLIVNQAEGNPFYTEELIKMLIQDGVILKQEDAWRIEAGRLTALRIPSTLTGILQARLDRLPKGQCMILEQAAVVGRRFWDSTLQRINAESVVTSPHPDIAETLTMLAHQEMIFSQAPSLFVNAHEYSFQHAILHDVAYERVLYALRKKYHALVADWLVENSYGRLGEHAGLVAEHLELAGKAEQAMAYWRKAGEQATARYANSEAISDFTRALALAPQDNLADRFELLLAREDLYSLQGSRAEQRQDLDALQGLATELGDPTCMARVALRQANYAWETNDAEAVVTAAQALIHDGEVLEKQEFMAAGELYWGRAHMLQAEYDQAEARYGRALAICQASGQRRMEANVLRALGIVAYYQGDLKHSRAYFEQTLPLYRHAEVRDRRGESSALNNLSNVIADQGDNDTAQIYLDQAQAIMEEIGDRSGVGMVLGNRASRYHDQGDYAGAVPYYTQSLQICRSVGERLFAANAQNNLGIVYLKLGQMEKARENLEAAIQAYQAIGDQRGETMSLDTMGRLHHQSGDHQLALEFCQAARALAMEIGSRHTASTAQTGMGHALSSLGQWTEAIDAYQQAAETMAQLDEQHVMIEPLAGLARCFLHQGDREQALEQVQILEALLMSEMLHPTIERIDAHFTCYQVLRHFGQPGARKHLEHARVLLHTLAVMIEDDTMRDTFLYEVTLHAEIMSISSED